jgi:hypothetical protein
MAKDYYHQVRAQIDAIENNLEWLEEVMERAKQATIGADLQKYKDVVNKENLKLLEKIAESLKDARDLSLIGKVSSQRVRL